MNLRYEPVWADAEGVEKQFEDLATRLQRAKGVERVSAIFIYYTRGFLLNQVPEELVIILSAAAGAIGQKVLDVAADIVRDYLRERQALRTSQQHVTIYDQQGKEFKKVVVDPPDPK